MKGFSLNAMIFMERCRRRQKVMVTECVWSAGALVTKQAAVVSERMWSMDQWASWIESVV